MSMYRTAQRHKSVYYRIAAFKAAVPSGFQLHNLSFASTSQELGAKFRRDKDFITLFLLTATIIKS
jgi:hypothetical protein